MRKKIPKFKTEDQEREFWATHDSTEYVDWEKGKRVQFPNLKPAAKTKSELVTDAAKDAEDLAVFEERAQEPDLSFEGVVNDLKRRGKI
jgi:hypothetical protein